MIAAREFVLWTIGAFVGGVTFGIFIGWLRWSPVTFPPQRTSIPEWRHTVTRTEPAKEERKP